MVSGPASGACCAQASGASPVNAVATRAPVIHLRIVFSWRQWPAVGYGYPCLADTRLTAPSGGHADVPAVSGLVAKQSGLRAAVRRPFRHHASRMADPGLRRRRRHHELGRTGRGRQA
ncbi:hypothetical protein G6F68_016923 [Rhizopus microsporus]|nr:hypothetical protein G6F68_016923 [Rhizopus microsporus]